MRSTIRFSALVLIALAVILPAQKSVAAPVAVVNCGVIANPGNYILKQALVSAVGQDCIDINAKNVRINLNGFNVTGGGAGGAEGISIWPQSTGAIVTNSGGTGAISNFQDGVLDNASHASIGDLRISNNKVSGVTVAGTAANPVSFSTVGKSVILENKLYGVHLVNTVSCSVGGNKISQSDLAGVWIQNLSANAVVGKNTVASNQVDYIGYTRIDIGANPDPAKCVPGARRAKFNTISGNNLPLDNVNSKYGIGLGCTSGNETVNKNNAKAHSLRFDLYDFSANCDANVWAGNWGAGTTRNQLCIH